MNDKNFHFDNHSRRGSDPRMVIVFVVFGSLVSCAACFSLFMSVVKKP